MSPRLRLTLLAALLAAACALLYLQWRDERRAWPEGMADTACRADGLPLGGRERDDWGALCAFRADNAPLLAARQPVRAVFIGDSLTQRWEELDRGALGPGLVRRGITGQTTQQILLRFQQDAADLHPRVIHILAGTNDVAANTGPFDPAMFQADIRAMVAQARGAGARVILGTLPPAHDFYWKPGVQPAPWVDRLNRWLAAYAREQGLVLADYHAVLANADGTYRKDLFLDGAHPNAQGYAAMRGVAQKALAEAERMPQ